MSAGTGTSTGTGGAAVVAALERAGVRVVFGIPGMHNLEIYRQLAGSPIRHVLTRHEQGAGYAADGYARASGRPGVVLTTSGPGLTNACTAAATAYADSVPLLLISPGPPRGQERADAGLLHEMKDSHAHLDSLVEASVRAGSAGHAAAVITEVFRSWPHRRARPVHLEVPLDILEGPWEGAGTRPVTVTDIRLGVGWPGPDGTPADPAADPAALDRAASLLAGAARPALVLGGGARDAAAEATALAEQAGAVVVTTVNGKGTVAETHPLSLGASIRLRAVQNALGQADVLLVVGSELGDSDLWGGAIRPSGAVIRVDIDRRQLARNLPADVAVHAPARQALRGLLDRLGPPAGEPAGDWAGVLPDIRTAAEAEAWTDAGVLRDLNEAMRAALPPDTIVAGDSTQAVYYGSVHFWPMDEPRGLLYPTGYATLGYGVPAGIGAKLACPSRPVVVLTGDGGLMFSVAELATAAELGLSLPVVVACNGGFGEIRDEMRRRGISPLGVDQRPPDFPALARALHCHGERVTSTDALATAVEAGLSRPGPSVIEVPLPG